MSELLENQRLSPEQLKEIGILLFGPKFKIALADFLGVDRRRINHWLDGDRPIPIGITKELLELAKQRVKDTTQALTLLKQLTGSLS